MISIVKCNGGVSYVLFSRRLTDKIEISVTSGLEVFSQICDVSFKPNGIADELMWFNRVTTALQNPDTATKEYHVNINGDLLNLSVFEKLSEKTKLLLIQCELERCDNGLGLQKIFVDVAHELSDQRLRIASLSKEVNDSRKLIAGLEKDIIVASKFKDDLQDHLLQQTCTLLNTKKREIDRLRKIVAAFEGGDDILVEGVGNDEFDINAAVDRVLATRNPKPKKCVAKEPTPHRKATARKLIGSTGSRNKKRRVGHIDSDDESDGESVTDKLHDVDSEEDDGNGDRNSDSEAQFEGENDRKGFRSSASEETGASNDICAAESQPLSRANTIEGGHSSLVSMDSGVTDIASSVASSLEDSKKPFKMSKFLNKFVHDDDDGINQYL